MSVPLSISYFIELSTATSSAAAPFAFTTGSSIILSQEIYIGCRQQETVAENNNNRMLHNKKENEMYADLDEIFQWAENNYIDVYMPIISRKEYKMMDRTLRLI